MKKHLIIVVLLAIQIPSFGQKGTGLKFMDKEEYQKIPVASSAMMGMLPERVDLSEWFPTPGDQGKQSSCVGWAVAYGLKSYQEAKERNQQPSTRNKIFSPSFIYNQTKLSNCMGGTHIVKALNFLKGNGVATLQDFPYSEYDCNKQPPQIIKQKAKNFTIAYWNRVNINDDIDIKSQLNAGLPIVIGMRVDDGFKNLGYNQIYRGRQGLERGNHAMVVVGYDDQKMAYKVLNSWGTNWGTNGYGWVSYTAFKNRVKEAYTVQDTKSSHQNNLKEIPQDNIQNKRNPSPIPQNAIQVSVYLGKPIVVHNQMVASPKGKVRGMLIKIPGSINNGVGTHAQLILRFYQRNGAPLFANISQRTFRDAHGLVATGTPKGPIVHNPATLEKFVFSIPYYALNFRNTKGRMAHNIRVQATIYINGFEKAKSPFTPMTIRY